MRPRPLYTLHPTPLAVLYSDLENHAAVTQEVLIGTPGSVTERENARGFRFYTRQFYDPSGKRRESYIGGPIGSEEAEERAARVRAQVEETLRVAREVRLLGREGYQVADARTYATLASLHNHGVFRAGATLIGSHAFGALLNQLGARAAAYSTEDVDIARAEPLAFTEPPTASLLDMLKGSGVDFVEVPSQPAQPSTRWKEAGRSRFHVDLLVPSPDERFEIIAIPELKAHAQSVPYLRYLLGETQPSLLIAREGCCQVRTPTAERFAIHKVLVSQLRGAGATKGARDLAQAAALLAVIAERTPGALAEAAARLPLSAGRQARAGFEALRAVLGEAHPRVWEELASL